ncbi:PepSY domain-containing protein [Bacillus altitudinis]|uniref:PepSY-associated TM helix domain-containing protein n=1 Tax=Bacillus altitudinis TaxID=293387 RepID=UPI002E1F9B0B|nr:PepSY domain-containing protein [Bacillus altitudinis]
MGLKKTGKNRSRGTAAFYQIAWRWHFYAGLIFMPIFVLLAVTGAIYLFKPQIEESMYDKLYHVKAEGEKLAPTNQIEAVKEAYPNAELTRYQPGEGKTRSAEVGFRQGEETYTAYVNPYTGQVLGRMNDETKFMNRVEEIHGELMAGTIGDRIVELTACWGIVLIVTGIYLWWPRMPKRFSGVIMPRLTKGKRLLIRDLHVVPAFWVSAGMLFLILTGLPWSGLWGNEFQKFATNTGEGYPPSVWVGDKPTSQVKTEEVADVPWAAEKMDVPASDQSSFLKLSMDDVVRIANEQKVHPAYQVYIPQTADGVYTLSVFPPKAKDEATVHLDQYTGAVLADYRYAQYGWMGKTIALGITLHKGTEFGLVNQLAGLLICVGIVGVVISGFLLWLNRKPKGSLGAPKAPAKGRLKWFVLLLVGLGIIFPLVGLSLIIVLLMDLFIIQRLPRLKQFLGA